MLEFRSGGWVIWLSALVTLGILSYHGALIWQSLERRAAGDGSGPYGFDLSTCLIPRNEILPVGPDLPRDGLPAMQTPPTLPGAETRGERLSGARKLTSVDRVVGVRIGGEARAYPLWILTWHEVCNDVLGGVPIAVTYSGLCDSVAVFDRRVAGETLNFGVSGLIYNCNLLMFDRRPEARGESLWLQLQARAVGGPAAREERRLELLPAQLTTWGAWLAAEPETSVILPDADRKRLYKRDAYSTYSVSTKLPFPVRPLPDVPPARYKSQVVAWREAGGTWRAALADTPAAALANDAPVRLWSMLFAWHAIRPDAPVEGL